jgi:DNA-binding transcriptional LysR family regulator
MLEDGGGKILTRFSSAARRGAPPGLAGRRCRGDSLENGREMRKIGGQATGKFQMINVNLLRLFVKVAETESIAGGARQLDIAPSIASRQIAALERAFKTKLLTRTTRRLSLTPAGAALLEWARTTVEGYEEVADELGAMQHRPSGVVRLASNDYAAVTYLPSILQKFCAKYPEVRIQLSTSTDPTKLLASVYDLAIHAGRMPDANLIGRRFRQYQRRLCATPAYLAQRGSIALPSTASIGLPSALNVGSFVFARLRLFARFRGGVDRAG